MDTMVCVQLTLLSCACNRSARVCDLVTVPGQYARSERPPTTPTRCYCAMWLLGVTILSDQCYRSLWSVNVIAHRCRSMLPHNTSVPCGRDMQALKETRHCGHSDDSLRVESIDELFDGVNTSVTRLGRVANNPAPGTDPVLPSVSYTACSRYIVSIVTRP